MRLVAFVEATEDARRELSTRVAALRRPDTYAETTAAVDAIETHMSWVFLTDDHAYKLKKPIRTPHLDYSTAEARRRACTEELRLNRRLAPSVYLDVVPLIADGRLRVNGKGDPIDWLVKMRRLPAERMLDVLIERSAVSEHEVRRLARLLARFYQRAEPQPRDGGGYRRRLSDDIDAKRASLEQPRYELPRDLVRAATDRLLEWCELHSSLLDARGETVVEAHGDLRPEHICLEPEPSVIDCLEFDRELRLLDPVSELSFLGLECRRIGAPEVGSWVLDEFGVVTGDRAPADLVRFYQSYHAVVRAAVAIWHLDDAVLDHTDAHRDKALTYLRIAECQLSVSSTSDPPV